MSNMMAWLDSYKMTLFTFAVAADAFARGAGWKEPIWVGSILFGLAAVIGTTHGVKVLQAKRLAKSLRLHMGD